MLSICLHVFVCVVVVVSAQCLAWVHVLYLGRNVAEGSGSTMLGVTSAIGFATNGSLIAVPQRHKSNKLQVAFLERNGLRHGDFDIQVRIAF